MKDDDKYWPPPFHPSITRLISSPLRSLPDFIIIGAQKSGSSSLFRYIEANPSVIASRRMELRYFDLNYNRGTLWYRAQFPTIISKYILSISAGTRIITGEASPDYLYHPLVPARVKKLTPNVKIIAILRNPIDRAYSHYQHEKRKGREKLTFSEALQVEDDRVRGEEEMLAGQNGYRSIPLAHYSYYRRGCYHNYLKNWFSHFDRKQILIIQSEKFFCEDNDTASAISKFLCIPMLPRGTVKSFNVGGYREEIDRTERLHLQYRYRDSNKKLFSLIGEEFDWPN